MSIFQCPAWLQFIDIIEWNEPPQNDILAYHRFPRAQQRDQDGREAGGARGAECGLFVNEGQLSDIFTNAGTYTLSTQNLPILSTLKGWKYGFESPFKAEVYFLSMRQWTDQKWGTQNPIMMRDPEFGPVRVRAFGSNAIHISDPAVFLNHLVVTDPMIETFEISNQLHGTPLCRGSSMRHRAARKIAVLDLAGNYDKISKVALEIIKPDLAALGLALTSFLIENISLPPEVEQALDQRTKMGVLGDMNKYTQYTRPALRRRSGMRRRIRRGCRGWEQRIAAGSAMADPDAHAVNSRTPPPAAPRAATTPANQLLLHRRQRRQPAEAVRPRRPRRQDPRGSSFTRQTLVWKQGMANWTPAESVPDLANLFAAVPPPLPK